jgi:hypothetical protein
VSNNGYAYWNQSAAHGTLRRSLVEEVGCPFGGRLWQPWVNHTLAHAEASRRGATRAVFAVLAPAANEALDAAGAIAELRRELSDPSTAVFLPLEDMVVHLRSAVEGRDAVWKAWADAVATRYLVPPGHRPPSGVQARGEGP